MIESQSAPLSSDLQEILDKLLPCIDPYCDNQGSTFDGSPDDPQPAQCQYCYTVRFPLLEALTSLIQSRERAARINSLLDLEQWAKLHDLDAEMILNGIEHMVKSILQVPNQQFLDHTDRIATLSNNEG